MSEKVIRIGGASGFWGESPMAVVVKSDESLTDKDVLEYCDGKLANLVLANGFSGHGIMHAPATGRGIAEVIVDGDWRSLDLSCFGYQRVRDNRPYREQGIV